MKRFLKYILLFGIFYSLSGCYTQFYVSNGSGYYATNDEYSESNYAEEDTTQTDSLAQNYSGPLTIYNFYNNNIGFPYYRFYWDYYPDYSLIWGYYDPFYWNWRPYWSFYDSYYSPYYYGWYGDFYYDYYPYYYGGAGQGYFYSYRSRALTRLRNTLGRRGRSDKYYSRRNANSGRNGNYRNRDNHSYERGSRNVNLNFNRPMVNGSSTGGNSKAYKRKRSGGDRNARTSRSTRSGRRPKYRPNRKPNRRKATKVHRRSRSSNYWQSRSSRNYYPAYHSSSSHSSSGNYGSYRSGGSSSGRSSGSSRRSSGSRSGRRR